MRDLFILGAGFSKAIYQDMPTMHELSVQVRENLETLDFPVPDELYNLGDNIELWMTYLSQAQPWLHDYENYSNLATARRIRKQIKEIIDVRTATAAQSAPPGWLNCLIRSWHAQRANILTLNYDTLVERATRELSLTDKIKRILAKHMYPPYFVNIMSRSGVGLWGEIDIDTFLYLKLHGSVNWYYSGRDNFYGETIFYEDVPPLGEVHPKVEEALRLISKDKEALIIPPVNEKTTYFNNETVEGLWKDARSALTEASRIVVIGYSLPVSDLGMRLFLINNQPAPQTPVYVVDPDPKVAGRYAKLLPDLHIVTEFTHGQNLVNRFSQQYPDIKP